MPSRAFARNMAAMISANGGGLYGYDHAAPITPKNVNVLMSLTNAQHQAAYRQRQADRLKRYEAALREIAGGSVEDPRIMADIAATALAIGVKS